MRCPKHEPETVGNIIWQLEGRVRCKNCGRFGRYSRGNRKFGRPRKILWASEWYSDNIIAQRYTLDEAKEREGA